jgi:hypothetical protein
MTFFFLRTLYFDCIDLMQGVSRENKLRLLMIYAALSPEKFESDKGAKLMQVNLYQPTTKPFTPKQIGVG